MPTSTVENYIKEIFLAQQKYEVKTVPMGVVAKALNVTAGTATTMVRSLSDANWVVYEPRVGVTLTEEGRELALSMIRRHRIVEQFLVQVLNLDWSEIHGEAECLEHAISDRVLESMDAVLGNPTIDPHGDPIPSADGVLDDRHLDNLSNCILNNACKVARIADQSAEFLHLMQTYNIKPGVQVEVIDRSNAAGSVTLTIAADNSITLGLSAAEKIFVD